MKSVSVIRAFSLTAVSLTLAFSAVGFAEGGERYVVRTGNPGAGHSAGNHGLTFHKSMKFEQAVVVSGSFEKVSGFAAAMGGSLEKDTIFSIPSDTSSAKSGGSSPAPSQTLPWGVAKIGAPLVSNQGAGVVVCVSDTGIDLNHPDLKANIISQVNTIQPWKTALDDHGHGSHVAGIIAAIDNTIGVVGVAPKAKLIAAKGLNRNGSGYASDLAETIDECRVRGAQVINMSWGSSTSSSLIADAVHRAYTAGILLVGAAGNESGPVIYPAAYSEVVAVSAVDSNDAFAYFSNFGSDVENSAPGVSILSTYKGGAYATMSGTSMAAPHVSGTAALMLSAFPGSTAAGLEGVDIGLSLDKQGTRGRIDAVLSTTP